MMFHGSHYILRARIGAVSLLIVVGLLPPLIMLFRWRDPPQTLSESIQEARR